MLFRFPQPGPVSAVAVYGAVKLILWMPPLRIQKYSRRPSAIAVVAFSALQPAAPARFVHAFATGSYFQKRPVFASNSKRSPLVGSYANWATLPFCAGFGAVLLIACCVHVRWLRSKYHMLFEK